MIPGFANTSSPSSYVPRRSLAPMSKAAAVAAQMVRLVVPAGKATAAPPVGEQLTSFPRRVGERR